MPKPGDVATTFKPEQALDQERPARRKKKDAHAIELFSPAVGQL